MDLTYLAVDKMRKDKGGYGGCVINISSGAGNSAEFLILCLFFACGMDLKLKIKFWIEMGFCNLSG